MYFFFLLHEICDKEENNLEKDLEVMGRRLVNVHRANHWWHSRNFFRPWEFKSKVVGLQATFFYLKVCLPVTCWAPVLAVSLRNKSACAPPGSVALLWAAEMIAAS